MLLSTTLPDAMEIMRLREAELRVKMLQDLLETGPERGPVLQVLDDVDGFWKSRVEGWVHDEDVVHAYHTLRSQADSLQRGEDVMDKVRSAVDRLLDFVRAAVAKGSTGPT